MSINQPLAEKMRPRELERFVGQTHLSSRLEALLKAKRLPSLLLFGPPGCGKSTLAMLLASTHSENWLRLSAPEAGLTQLRKQLAGVDVLVLDELHRFSKAQQDFFLPILESGEITLLATTTENPSFSVTRQLLSRLHILRLRMLSRDELIDLAKRGLKDIEFELGDDVLEFLASAAHGDARMMFNLIEHLNNLSQEDLQLDKIKRLMPEIVARHDKDGDSHYELASALIKSIRGSDVDAALYYLACLLEGGEDPRFITRRLILSASEDVGLADPQALGIAVACQQAVEFVGMPEGYIPLAETVVYLALARKSNSSYAAYAVAQREVRLNGMKPVPLHLRNASTSLQREWGYGKEYKYPHNYVGGYVEQQYLPQELIGRKFYKPKEIGDESRLIQFWKKINKD